MSKFLETLEGIKKEVDAGISIYSVYSIRHHTTFQSRWLWDILEITTALALLDERYAEDTRVHREFIGVILMQRGMNG